MYKNLFIRRKQNMKRINDTLWKDYDSVDNQIKDSTSKDDGYRTLLEERDKIRNELLKYEQAAMEAELKRFQVEKEAELKIAQMEAENKQKEYSNWITIGTFAGTLAFSVLAMYKTFYFDEKATVTSTLGRAILNGTLPKISKR
jgi:hypothetical protein